MGKIRVEFIPQFYMGEDDAVLVAVDRDGLEQLGAAIRQAGRPNRDPNVLRIGQQTHVFLTEEDVGVIEFRDDQVIWRRSPERLEEIACKLEPMKTSPGPCHQYVDIREPASVLILSLDEYPDRIGVKGSDAILGRAPGRR